LMRPELNLQEKYAATAGGSGAGAGDRRPDWLQSDAYRVRNAFLYVRKYGLLVDD